MGTNQRRKNITDSPAAKSTAIEQTSRLNQLKSVKKSEPTSEELLYDAIEERAAQSTAIEPEYLELIENILNSRTFLTSFV